MSSYWTIISCAEWDRLKESIAAADAYEIESREEIARLRTLEQARQWELDRLCQETRHRTEDSIHALTESYRAAAEGLDLQARARLAEQDRSFAGQLEQLRAQAAQTGTRASALTEGAEAAAREYSAVLEQALAEHSRGEERAKRTLEEVDRLLEQVRALHPSAFLPAAYPSLEAMRASISANLAAGDFQAAMVVSQNSILEASRALIQLVLLQERHSRRIEQLQERGAALQTRAERLSAGGGTLTVEMDREPAQLPYSIQFWSYGAFDGINGQISALNQELRREADTPTGLDRLGRLEEQLARLEERLEACDQEARQSLAGAAAVENTVQRIYSRLDEQGWTLESSGRQDGDTRKPYSMTYTDGGGNTVSIVVASGERPERPSFLYEAFSPSEGMAAMVKEDVGAALREEGLIPEHTVERDDCALNASPDVFIRRAEQEAEQLRRRGRQRGWDQ